MRRIIFMKLLILMISCAYAEEFERTVPQITKKYIIASRMCFQEKKDKERIEDCRPVIKLSQKKKITKSLNRQILCDQVISNYIIHLMPVNCSLTYCGPCVFTESVN